MKVTFDELQVLIVKAQAENKPIDMYVKKQIELLKFAHDEFILEAKQQGYNINTQSVADIELQQYYAMKQLAQKIGLPIEEYDELIKNVKIRLFGEENYKKFFET